MEVLLKLKGPEVQETLKGPEVQETLKGLEIQEIEKDLRKNITTWAGQGKGKLQNKAIFSRWRWNEEDI